MLGLQRPSPVLQSVGDLTIPVSGGLDGRLYRPGPGWLPVLVYFHGGGFVIGDAAYQQPLRELALATMCLIVAPNVRLAPEHRFPAAVEDALACARVAPAARPERRGGDQPFCLAGHRTGGKL